MNCYYLIFIFILVSGNSDKCIREGILSKETLAALSKKIIPDINKKSKGDAGRIGVLGGSDEYSGAPYFGAYSALRVGADLVYIITSETAAPIIKAYSPDLIVYSYLSKKHSSKISEILKKLDVVVIGPGLGREDEQIKLIFDVIETCRSLKKPIVIDADGLYALSKNITVLLNYPKPGVILTPNGREAARLIEAINSNATPWYNYWGGNVSVLVKGYEDTCYTSETKFNWSLFGGGSDRRAAGQGDILAGALGTFYNWALKSNLCENGNSTQLAQSVAIYAAAKFTRTCNTFAYVENGRNMIASDMLNKIHTAFDELFSS
ncbi:unnamed protein product [Chilo suppressalis]|uniref:ATP-dependent (S)-NAD(P)H-hydrate dehydratase n=1 Tax=Chilo suppressalis TaxID=168631 RepID=A0ABN8B551_CHISP|nr:hypothetical protein evm_003973 [Chilo suppressalis]CAH0401197.1 unnamed protein product [Chilo suppressalis]